MSAFNYHNQEYHLTTLPSVPLQQVYAIQLNACLHPSLQPRDPPHVLPKQDVICDMQISSFLIWLWHFGEMLLFPSYGFQWFVLYNVYGSFLCLVSANIIRVLSNTDCIGGHFGCFCRTIHRQYRLCFNLVGRFIA